MPISEFQSRVLLLLAANRTPDSFVAGATIINSSAGSPRFSKDIDINHDAIDSLASSAAADESVLVKAGFEVFWTVRRGLFHRARVRLKDEELLLEWVYDSAFRFFPVEADPLLGYKLNFWDAATNKMLALVGRMEPRDFLDIVYLHENFLSLGALAWAAAGKDPGLNPSFILEEATRSTRYQPEEFADLSLARPLDLPQLRQNFLKAVAEAREFVLTLPAQDVGCFYVDDRNNPVEPHPTSSDFGKLKRHFGSVHGAWPTAR